MVRRDFPRPTRRRFLVGAAAAISAFPGAARAGAAVGAPAPDFAMPDTQGRMVRLSALRGRVVALEWTNPLCPFAGKHYEAGAMQALQRETLAAGGSWYSVISYPRESVGYASELEAELLAETRRSAATATLLDPDTALAKLYDARATPHIFIVDRAGVLAYAGGMDSVASTEIADIARAEPYARDALRAVVAGLPVARPVTAPYGCQVKHL
ncbi:MAG: redoxin domain-containing protein [Rhodospirillales bacterium]|nr:MAG: redoxin domain-containing protein [Rhodospirillales bacterium]